MGSIRYAVLVLSLFASWIQGTLAQGPTQGQAQPKPRPKGPDPNQPPPPLYELTYQAPSIGKNGGVALAAGKTSPEGITALVERTTQPPLQFHIRARRSRQGVFSIRVFPPVAKGKGNRQSLALIAYSGTAPNITTYDLALVTNPRNLSSPAVKALYWNEWVVDEKLLKPVLANTTGTFRPYAGVAEAAKSPLQEIDQNAVQIYYDTNGESSVQGPSDNAAKTLADVHFVKKPNAGPGV